MPVYFSKLSEYKMGNSLFQAAATIALARRNNDKFFFPENYKYRYSFNFPQDCFVPSNQIKPASVYNEPYFHYAPITYSPNIDLGTSYYQSEKYFEDYKDYIKEIFTPNHNVAFKDGVASIHVRRTDYLNYPDHHPVPSMNYYEAAIELVGVNKFIVFSDDIRWCKEHFIGNQFDFSEGNSDLVDLALQINCEHNIICNSTFSWWASYLNKNPNKIVVAPQRWFGQALSLHNTKDLYLPEWYVI